MNKRKIFTLAMAVMMVAILAIGGSLAYLTDTDAKNNVFTVGNVTIDLWENFDLTDDDGTALDGIATLHPVTRDENGDVKDDNKIQKEVFITNTGSELAYVRVHIAIPSILDDAQPNFDASKNVLHFNMDKETFADGLWSWKDTYTTGAGYESGMKDWNYYSTEIEEEVDGQTKKIPYNVYVVTYRTALAADDVTPSAISTVYLEETTTNEDITRIKAELGDNWHIRVAAEGTQEEGFANAYEALNVSFGIPGEYDIDWNVKTNDTIGDRDWTLGENSDKD